MSTPDTYTVTRDVLISVFLSGYSSGTSTAAANRHKLAALDGLDTDDDLYEFGAYCSDELVADQPGRDATWRNILACLSGTNGPRFSLDKRMGD